MARSARRMPIPSRETQQPPTGGQRRRRGAGVSRKKRDLSAAAPCPSQRPTPIYLRTDRRRRCRRFASHTSARVTARVPVNTRKTQRRARDAQEKTSARPPCDRVELKSPIAENDGAARARSFRTSVLLDKGVDDSRQTGVRLRSRHHNHSRSLAHPPLPPHPPRLPLDSRPLWQCSRSSRLLCAPCKPRDCAVSTQALASVPKAHSNALRVSQPGGGRPFQPQESSTMGSHKGREGQGARKVYHDRRLASPLTTWFTVPGERYS